MREDGAPAAASAHLAVLAAASCDAVIASLEHRSVTSPQFEGMESYLTVIPGSGIAARAAVSRDAVLAVADRLPGRTSSADGSTTAALIAAVDTSSTLPVRLLTSPVGAADLSRIAVSAVGTTHSSFGHASVECGCQCQLRTSRSTSKCSSYPLPHSSWLVVHSPRPLQT